MNENGKFCITCGKPLIGKQGRYCCKRCRYIKPQEKHICENPHCRKVFITANTKQKYCCPQCNKVASDNTIKDPLKAANRPFTSETKYIIRMWYNNGNGDSKQQIAMILGRSLNNIEQAFV